MLVKVGTLVLCHLIIKTSNPQDGTQTQRVDQVPGIVKDISYVDYIEMFQDKYAVKKKKTMLVVEPEEKDKIFRVGADACRPVIEESAHLELTRRRLEEQSANKKKAPVKAKTPTLETQGQEPTLEDAAPPVKVQPPVDEAPKKVDIENLDSDKAKLLQQLEE